MHKDINEQLKYVENATKKLEIQYNNLFKNIDNLEVNKEHINDLKELFSMLNSGNINEVKVQEIQNKYADKINK